ncbi:MAG: hypothetical protein Q7R93_03145 [bacterium]|nr:hypothetical protein [bacterium]
MRKPPLLLLLSVFLFPLATFAATIHFGDYFLKGSESTEDDIYVLGETSALVGSVQGDSISIGRTIFSQSDITGDALFIGDDVKVEGVVRDDARLIGNTIRIDGIISDDVVVIGSKILISQSARVEGSLYVIGQDVEVSGTVLGEAKIFSQRVKITGSVAGDLELWGRASFVPPASVGGDLILHSKKATESPVGVTVTGKVIHDNAAYGPKLSSSQAFLGGLFSLKILMFLALGFALFLLVRERSEEVLLDTLSNFKVRLLRGMLILILLPVVTLILFFSVIGIPIALLTGSFFVILSLLSWGYAGILVGVWSERFFFKHSAFPLTYRPVLLGVIFLSVLSLIPIVGPLLNFLLMLAVAGSLGTLSFRQIRARV